MGKRRFLLEFGGEKLEVEGYEPRNVVIKYLMKRRRSLLMTKDLVKVEALYVALPLKVAVQSTKASRTYKVNCERVGTGEFEGARFTFTLEEESV